MASVPPTSSSAGSEMPDPMKSLPTIVEVTPHASEICQALEPEPKLIARDGQARLHPVRPDRPLQSVSPSLSEMVRSPLTVRKPERPSTCSKATESRSVRFSPHQFLKTRESIDIAQAAPTTDIDIATEIGQFRKPSMCAAEPTLIVRSPSIRLQLATSARSLAELMFTQPSNNRPAQIVPIRALRIGGMWRTDVTVTVGC